MSMYQIPILVIGVGGIGCRIAASISSSLTQDDWNHTSVIGIDTDVHELGSLDNIQQMKLIQISSCMKVRSYLEAYPECSNLFPENVLLREKTMLCGTEQIRPLSRLAFLHAEKTGGFRTIIEEVNRLYRSNHSNFNMNLQVIIVGSTAGGTGSGLIVQIPFYIREVIRKYSEFEGCGIRGFFIGSDVVEEVLPTKIKKDAACANSYACLKELNAFCKQPFIDYSDENNVCLDFHDHEGRSENNILYNFICLMEKNEHVGAIDNFKLDEIINHVSELIKKLYLTPMIHEIAKVENIIYSNFNYNPKNLLCIGAGMCRLVYPIKKIQEYVAMSTVIEFLKNEWLFIDRQISALEDMAEDNIKFYENARKIEMEKSYIEIFSKEVFDNNSPLRRFAKKAFHEFKETKIPVSVEFIDLLDATVEKELYSDEDADKIQKWICDADSISNFSYDKDNFAPLFKALEQYRKHAKEKINTIPSGLADHLFPLNENEIDSKSGKNIFHFLSSVHPIVGRFLVYDIINRLESKIADLSEKISKIDPAVYMEEPYEYICYERRCVDEEYNKIWDSENPILRLLSPLRKKINYEEKANREFKKRFCEFSLLRTYDIRNYMEISVKLAVSKLVLERINQLAANYTLFFDMLVKKLSKLNDEVSNLEYIQFPFGQKGIYCSEKALKNILNEYISMDEPVVSDDANKKIFEKIYFAQSYASDLTNTSEKEKNNETLINHFETVFDNIVVDKISYDIRKYGLCTVNLTAERALIKEFELECGIVRGDDDYYEQLQKIMQTRVESALDFSLPMLSIESDYEYQRWNYLLAAKDFFLSEYEFFHLLNNKLHTDWIMNEKFDDSEMVIIKIIGAITIEDLTNYKDGSRNYCAYKERISNIDSKDAAACRYEELLNYVTPHLNFHWHEESFIPPIHDV